MKLKTTLEFCFTDHVGFDLWNGEHREGQIVWCGESHENVIGGHYQAGWSAMGYGHLSNVETETFPDFYQAYEAFIAAIIAGRGE